MLKVIWLTKFAILLIVFLYFQLQIGSPTSRLGKRVVCNDQEHCESSVERLVRLLFRDLYIEHYCLCYIYYTYVVTLSNLGNPTIFGEVAIPKLIPWSSPMKIIVSSKIQESIKMNYQDIWQAFFSIRGDQHRVKLNSNKLLFVLYATVLHKASQYPNFNIDLMVETWFS